MRLNGGRALGCFAWIILIAGSPRASAQGATAVPMSFSEMTLAQAEDAAINASPDVAAARARVVGAKSALSLAEAGVLPTAFANFTEAPQAGNGPAVTTIATHLTTVGYQATLNDLLFGFVPAIRAAAFSLRAAVDDEVAAERGERITAARAYFGALKAAAVLAASEDALRLARSELNAAQTRYRAGDVPRVDVVRAQVSVARAEADAANAQASDENAREALRAETSANTNAFFATAGGAPPSIPGLALDPAAAAAQAARLRPEVLSAQAAVDASIAARTSARFVAGLPPVSVSAGYASGVDSGQRVHGAAVTAQVSVPIPFVPAARLGQADAAVEEAQAHFAAVVRTVSLETAAAARSLSAADLAAAATLRARDAARQELDAEELGYRSGAASGLELAQARTTYAQAEVDALSAVYDEAVAVAVFNIEAGR